jgi:hypothetical protein
MIDNILLIVWAVYYYLVASYLPKKIFRLIDKRDELFFQQKLIDAQNESTLRHVEFGKRVYKELNTVHLN